MAVKSEIELIKSPVVANSAMNRDRVLRGRNGYDRELGFDPLAWLLTRPSRPSWVDLCCGSGRALAEAGEAVAHLPDRVRPRIIGIDLIEPPGDVPGFEFVVGPVATWEPSAPVDLVTCVHGLHYLGDKLGVLARVSGWLAEGGRFAANLDLRDIETPAGRRLGAVLRAHGFLWNADRHRVTRLGPGTVDFAYEFLGGDDDAGPNYTGQPAVRSVYRAAARANSNE